MYEYILPKDFTQILTNWNTNDSMPQEASSGIKTQSTHEMKTKVSLPPFCVAMIVTYWLSSRSSRKRNPQAWLKGLQDTPSDLKDDLRFSDNSWKISILIQFVLN